MQEFASINATSKESCPTDEELAAYIDGTLGRADRKRITQHLASCEDCYAVYMGTVRFQLDSEPADKAAVAAGNVVRFPSKEQVQGVRRLAAAAAVLVIVAGAGGGYHFAGPLPALLTAEVTPSATGKPIPAGSLWLGPTFRGGGDESEEALLYPASFQMGVQLVNLQVSLEAGDGEQAQDVVARILQLLEDQLFVEELKTGYTAITVAIADGAAPKDLAGKAAELARQAREAFDAPHLDLGQWTEAGRLAAIAEQPSFFQRRNSRAFLRRLLWRQKLGLGEMTLEPDAGRSLREISEVVAKGDLGRAEYSELRRDFDTILGIYYPQS